MAIKSRQELELCFKNGTLPSEKNFQDLIHSMLNRTDDNFFGKWKAGTRYCPGDVVIYQKSLYIVKGSEQALECSPLDAKDPDDAKCFCSTEPPHRDCAHWELVELKVEDEDWVVLKDETGKQDDIMYAGVFGKIGMGTQHPQARVDITIQNKGSFLFDPGDHNAPEFVIQDDTCADVDPEIRQSINRHQAYWYINVPGYAFKKIRTNEGEEAYNRPDLLMFITTDERDIPAVGIGTQHPDAALDVKEAGEGQILLRPGGARTPEFIVVNLKDDNDFECYSSIPGGQIQDYIDSFFKISVGKKATAFRNKFGNKILFTRMAEYAGPMEEFDRKSLISAGEVSDPDEKKKREEVLMSITQREDDEGSMETMVGIGTEDPHAHLEVTDGETGRIMLSLNKTNPALAIVNIRPNENLENYLTLGVNNKRGVFVTDSPKGFEFRFGNPCGNNDSELDIDQHGKVLLSIDKDAKVGIGKHPSHQYELDVNGEIKSFGSYLETHRDSMEDPERLDGKKMLEKLRKIHPVSFNWKPNTWNGQGSEARQIGVLGHEVADVFEELVKNLDDGNHAVAYQNMVGVLIAAINELNKEVKELKDRLGNRD